MREKYFFKNQSSLKRKVIAGGLSAVFSAGMYGSYAGAMNLELGLGLGPNVVENKLPKQEDEIIEITYKKPEGQQGKVECRLKNSKIEFKMIEGDKRLGVDENDKNKYEGYWVSFHGYEGEKDNDIVGFIRDNFEKLDDFHYAGCMPFDISELIRFSKNKGNNLSLIKEDIIFEYLKYCKDVLKKSLKDSYEKICKNFEVGRSLDEESLEIFMIVLISKFPELEIEDFLSGDTKEEKIDDDIKKLLDILKKVKGNKSLSTAKNIEKGIGKFLGEQDDYANEFEKTHRKSRYKLYITLGVIAFLVFFLGGGTAVYFGTRDSKEEGLNPNESAKGNENKEQMNPKNVEKGKETENNDGQADPIVAETKSEGKSNAFRNVVLSTTGAVSTIGSAAVGIYAKNKSKSGAPGNTLKENKNAKNNSKSGALEKMVNKKKDTQTSLVYVDSKNMEKLPLKPGNENSNGNTRSKDSTLVPDEELNIPKDNKNK